MDSELLKKALINGVKNLVNQQSTINNCNFFPVPDKDTGTNMAITVLNAYSFFQEYDGTDCKIVLELFSKGAFFGARGNSGIILSQIFHGLYKAVPDNCKEINSKIFFKLLTLSVKYAKKSVVSVANFSIISALSSSYKSLKSKKLKNYQDLKVLIKSFLNFFEQELNKTAKVYPESNNKKVVDSGALGFYSFLEGFYFQLIDKQLEFIKGISSFSELNKLEDNKTVNLTRINDNVDHGYCCEVLINSKGHHKKDHDLNLKKEISTSFKKMGMDSICVITTQDLIKLHAHSSSPDEFLRQAMSYGDLIKIKIENMNYQPETHSFFSSSELAEETQNISLSPEVVDNEVDNINTSKPLLFVFLYNNTIQTWIKDLNYKNIRTFIYENSSSVQKDIKNISQNLINSKSKKIIILTTIQEIYDHLIISSELYKENKIKLEQFFISSPIVLYFLVSYWNADWNFNENVQEIKELICNIDYSYIIENVNERSSGTLVYSLVNGSDLNVVKSSDILKLFINQLKTTQKNNSEIVTILIDNKLKKIKRQFLEIIHDNKHKLSEIKMSFCKLYGAKLIEFCSE